MKTSVEHTVSIQTQDLQSIKALNNLQPINFAKVNWVDWKSVKLIAISTALSFRQCVQLAQSIQIYFNAEYFNNVKKLDRLRTTSDDYL